MKRTHVLTLSLLALTLVLPAAAADKKKKDAGAQMSPEMMEKMMRASMPTDNHRKLEPMVGRFTYTASMWMDPKAAPSVSTGTSMNTWVYSGRFLKQDVSGAAMGQPFQGTGFIGYDNMRQQYESVWMDSMSTGIMKSTGKAEADGTIKMSGTFSCPMTGETDRAFRTELKINGADKHTYTSFDKDPAGKEFKSMEIVYTRAK